MRENEGGDAGEGDEGREICMRLEQHAVGARHEGTTRSGDLGDLRERSFFEATALPVLTTLK